MVRKSLVLLFFRQIPSALNFGKLMTYAPYPCLFADFHFRSVSSNNTTVLISPSRRRRQE